MVGLIYIVLACASQDQPITPPEWVSDCPDAECRQEWMLQHIDEPDVLTRALQDIEAPEERIALVKVLLDRQPGLPQSICTALPQGDARQYCQHLNNRPHLTESPRTAPVVRTSRVGPANVELDCVAEVVSAVDALEAPATECEDASDPRSCYSMAAMNSAEAGELMAGAALCKRIPEGPWQAECLFYSAETGVKAKGADVYRDATELCIAAAPFRQHCQSHIISALSFDTPTATAPAEAWVETIADAERIAAAWDGRDDRMKEMAVGRFWSEALFQSYREQPATGSPFTHLPAAAHPHIRSAMVWRLVDTNSASSLEQWVALAMAAQDSEYPHDPTSGVSQRPDYPQVRDLWGQDRGNDVEIPAAFYLSSARRAVSNQADVDLKICLLEALARTPDGRRYMSVGDDEHRLVKWTAQRLGRF